MPFYGLLTTTNENKTKKATGLRQGSHSLLRAGCYCFMMEHIEFDGKKAPSIAVNVKTNFVISGFRGNRP